MSTPYVGPALKFWFSKEPHPALSPLLPRPPLDAHQKRILDTVGHLSLTEEQCMTPFEEHRLKTGMLCPCRCACEEVDRLWDRYRHAGCEFVTIFSDNVQVKDATGFTRLLELYFAGHHVEVCREYPETYAILRCILQNTRDWMPLKIESPITCITDTFHVEQEVAYALLCWLDRSGLVEHGVGIGSAWINNTGREFLQELEECLQLNNDNNDTQNNDTQHIM